MSGVPQGCVLGPLLLSISISHTDSGIKGHPQHKGGDARQGDLDKLQKWAQDLTIYTAIVDPTGNAESSSGVLSTGKM